MFQVFEGCRGSRDIQDYELPCDRTGFAWAKTWENSRFAQWIDAITYANCWLGDQWARHKVDAWKPNEEYHYCGKSYVVIREI